MFRSFCITVRPRDGINNDTVEEIHKWLSRHPNFAFAVLEMEGECRHLHAQLWYDDPKNKGDIQKALTRICERTIPDWDAKQKKVMAGGTKVAINDWYLHYLTNNDLKIDDPNILIDKPPNISSPYYPSDEEQEKVKTMARAVDPRFAKLEMDYKEKYPDTPVTLKSVASFLSDAMFISRTIKVIVHQRDRTALCSALYAYISHSTDIELFIHKSKQDRDFEKLVEKVAEYQFDEDEEENLIL